MVIQRVARETRRGHTVQNMQYSMYLSCKQSNLIPTYGQGETRQNKGGGFQETKILFDWPESNLHSLLPRVTNKIVYVRPGLSSKNCENQFQQEKKTHTNMKFEEAQTRDTSSTSNLVPRGSWKVRIASISKAQTDKLVWTFNTITMVRD